LNHAVLDPNVP